MLLAVLVLGLVFTAGDARELVHQLDESNGGLATVAAVLIALHLAVRYMVPSNGKPCNSTTGVPFPCTIACNLLAAISLGPPVSSVVSDQ